MIKLVSPLAAGDDFDPAGNEECLGLRIRSQLIGIVCANSNLRV